MTQDMEHLIQRYTEGSCHIYALANVTLHGGSFIIVRDTSELVYESEDGESDKHAVLHVLSVHDSPHGVIIRDVLGDRPLEHDLVDEMSGLFNVWPGDISIERQVVLSELYDEIEDDEDIVCDIFVSEPRSDEEREVVRPLSDFSKEDLVEALELEIVKMLPGTRPLPSGPVLVP